MLSLEQARSVRSASATVEVEVTDARIGVKKCCGERTGHCAVCSETEGEARCRGELACKASNLHAEDRQGENGGP